MNKFDNIAALVRKYRKNRGVSQNWLAIRLGFTCSGQFFSNVERGICTVPPSKIATMSILLKMPMDEIEDAVMADFKSNLGIDAMDGFKKDDNLTKMVVMS